MKRHTLFLAITALSTVALSAGCGQKIRLSANNLYSSELLQQISNGALVPISFEDDGVRAIEGRPSQERPSYLVRSGIQPGTYEMVFNGEEMSAEWGQWANVMMTAARRGVWLSVETPTLVRLLMSPGTTYPASPLAVKEA
jgi:hypothetical protein